MESQYVSYLLAGSDFFESLGRYAPNESVFLAPARQILPEGWTIVRKGPWFNAVPPNPQYAAQGWKIHLSAGIAHAADVLGHAARVLVDEATPFKFAVDLRVLRWLNSKNCPRGHAGKFMTVYPADEAAFRRLVERLDEATAALAGPYILSDRRYRTSRIVYYRYGGVAPGARCDVRGHVQTFLTGPDGESVEDERNAFAVVPAWTADPFGAPEPYAGDLTLKNGRYAIVEVLSFKTSGGVYLATDGQTGSTVVIKEARPHVGGVSGRDDAVALLRREYQILQRIADCRVAAEPLDLFEDWENWFLVEEHLDGVGLGTHSARAGILDVNSHTPEGLRAYLETFRSLFAKIARAIDRIHQRGVVLCDLSPNNVVVVGDDQIRLIDFEAAFVEGEQDALDIFTPGFAPFTVGAKLEPATRARDRYTLGAMMLSYLLPMTPLLALKESAGADLLDHITSDIPLPPAIVDVIRRLLDRDPGARPELAEVLDALDRTAIAVEAGPAPAPAVRTREPLAALLTKATRYIQAVADFSRDDRLFPAHVSVFTTNPLNIAYGACGVATVLKQVLGECPERVTSWILAQPLDSRLYPPGFYVGLSGIAWTLLDLGREADAERVLDRAARHQFLFESPDLFYGASGWGMANLKFFDATGDWRYLHNARAAGAWLGRSGIEDVNSPIWMDGGRVPLGLAHGRSGAALFLLYLHAVTGEREWLEAGEQALQFDLDRAVTMPFGGVSWPRYADNVQIVAPYWKYGSAGIGGVVVRYAAVTGSSRYAEMLERIVPDVDHKYTAFPGQMNGLAGQGCTLLDMHRFTGDVSYYRRAARLAESLRIFAIEKPEGVAFPGDRLVRISCDYATGAAGIVHFLHRLLEGSDAAFTLDALLARPAVGEAPSGAEPELAVVGR